MRIFLGFIILAHSAKALKASGKSEISMASASESGEGGVSAQELWQRAWEATLEKFHVASMMQLPDYLQADLQKEAKKLWKSLLQKRQQLIDERMKTETTTTDEFATTTTPGVLRRLLAGVNGPDTDDRDASFAQAPAGAKATVATVATTTSTTTTTVDPQIAIEKEKAAKLKKEALMKLTAGFSEDNKKETEFEATSTTTIASTTTSTTTENKELKKLMEGVDSPAAQSPSAARKHTTTTSTTTTTVSTTIGAAGRKVLSFITSGTFAMPPHHTITEPAPAADSKEDDDSDQSEGASDDGRGDAANDFDLDNQS